MADPHNGMPPWEERLRRIHPEDQAKRQKAIERAIAEKSDYDVEFRIVPSPGTAVRYIHTLGHPVLDQSGELGDEKLMITPLPCLSILRLANTLCINRYCCAVDQLSIVAAHEKNDLGNVHASAAACRLCVGEFADRHA